MVWVKSYSFDNQKFNGTCFNIQFEGVNIDIPGISFTHEALIKILNILDDCTKTHIVDDFYSSVIKENFFGSVRKVSVCNVCKTKSQDIEEIPYFVIPASGSVVGGVKHISNPSDLLLFCVKCNSSIMHTCTTTIWHQPKCSIILVNRFIQNSNGTITKSNSLLDCDNVINLPEFKGKLISFVTHLGPTTSSGHYMASVNNGREWYRCNDVSVTLTDANFHSKDVYQLFYSK